MRKMKSVRFMAASALATTVFCWTSVAMAQESAAPQAPKTADAADAENADEGIIVTGSRIARPNLESTNPITTVTGEEFLETGNLSIGDALNDLPQLRSTFSQQNSTRFLGTRGLNLLDLRGLGTQRTLVLVNGRRHVGSDILNNGVSPDTNTFPTQLIERVDIVTGGKSGVYGSDAVAGVVNFILKDNYDGVELRARAGVSRYNDAGNQSVSLLAGKNFAAGRGNIAINLEFAHSERYYGSGRPNLRRNNAFVVVDTDPAGSVNGADDVFDRAFFTDLRSTTISPGGQIGIRQPTVGAACGVDSVGNPFTCAFLFQSDGTLIPQTGLRVGLGPNGSFVSGNGDTGRTGQRLTLSPDIERYSVNLIGHFEVSPAFVPFVEAKYARTRAFGSQSGPFFSQGQTLTDGITVAGFNDRSYASTTSAANGTVNREGIRLDNPFLSAQARAVLTQQITASLNANVNPNTGAAFSTTAASQANRTRALAQVADGSFRFSNRRTYLDLGIRDEEITRETYRAVAGVKGVFNNNWRYEVSGNYGEFREKNAIQSNINRQRFILANDSVRNTAGNIVCRSQVDPNFAGVDRAGNPAVLAADIAACVPINPFGEGNVSQATRNYLTVASSAVGKITQFNGLAFVSGDLGQLFELPGGPIAFSVGGEYRRETNFYDLDDVTQAGYAFYNAIPTLAPPRAFEVKELFGEISVPLVKDVPLLRELTLEGTGRVADYKGPVGTVYAYSGGVIWKPISDLTLRGSYSRSVRSPNLNELFSAQSQNFTPAPNDPCSARNIATGSATRLANCNAAGRPASYDFVYTSSLEIKSGGNPNLSAETSNSYTGGFVYAPSFVPGLSISADFYDVKVKKVIANVGTAQAILNLCYDSATLNNPFCALFVRATAAGGPRGEQEFRVLEGSLTQTTANFAALVVRGIDTNVSYQHKFDWATISASAVWTHVLRNDSFTDPTNPNFVDRIIGELGDPKDQVNFNAAIKRGKVRFGYQLRWIAGQFLNTFEDYNSVNGLPPQNTDFAPIKKYPSVWYHDIRLDADVTDRFNFFFGIDNVTDRKPPFGLTGVGGGSGIFDNRGRFFYTGVTAKF